MMMGFVTQSLVTAHQVTEPPGRQPQKARQQITMPQYNGGKDEGWVFRWNQCAASTALTAKYLQPSSETTPVYAHTLPRTD